MRTSLTKSLHTVTAVTNVARLIAALPRTMPATAETLAIMAMTTLHVPGLANLRHDDPVARACVDALAKLNYPDPYRVTISAEFERVPWRGPVRETRHDVGGGASLTLRDDGTGELRLPG